MLRTYQASFALDRKIDHAKVIFYPLPCIILPTPPPLTSRDLVARLAMGCGGALVESIAFNRRVMGSTPALAAT